MKFVARCHTYRVKFILKFCEPGPKFTNIVLRFIVRYVLRLS